MSESIEKKVGLALRAGLGFSGFATPTQGGSESHPPPSAQFFDIFVLATLSPGVFILTFALWFRPLTSSL
jgi:hypothetical protein